MARHREWVGSSRSKRRERGRGGSGRIPTSLGERRPHSQLRCLKGGKVGYEICRQSPVH